MAPAIDPGEARPATLDDIRAASARIAPFVRRTPLLPAGTISSGAARPSLLFKCENLQLTGSFKIRGATNAVQRLAPADAPRGVVTHSSGNHALALVAAANARGIPAYVVMPANASPVKRAAVVAAGGIVETSGNTAAEREALCEAVRARTGATIVPPYDHAWTIAGQGTIALEILADAPDTATIVVPVGGGGMIAGMAIAAKALQPGVRIVGAEPALADDAAESKRTGTRAAQRAPVTIADGLRAPLGELTFPVVRDLVDEIVTVGEDEIVAAMRRVYEDAKLVIEPSAGVGVAAVLGSAMRDRAAADEGRGRTVVVLCGGNADLGALPW